MIDKIFPRKLNRSKDARLLDKTEMYNAINISIDDFDTAVDDTSDTGDAGVIKPVKGNDAITQDTTVLESNESARVIGSVVDEVNGQIYLFVFSTNAEKQGVYRITADDNVEAIYVSEYFEFQNDDFVKGDIVYHSDGNVILYFTDGRNEPKKLSLDDTAIAAATGASASRVKDFITACPKTPMHPPTWEFFSEPTKPINFRSVEGFQFAYQCIYSTGEESAISTYSDVAIPTPYLTQGSLTEPNLEAANGLLVKIPKEVRGIPNYTDNIERIRLLVRIGNDGAFFTVSEKDAATGSDELTFEFYNDSVLTGVPQEDQDKLNDALPRIARAQTVINDRLIYGNYTEGYETNSVNATLTTVNTPRPEDFVDLKIGVRPLISPAFADSPAFSEESPSNISVSLNGENFDITQEGVGNKVFNRRASYQFDLSDLPSVLPEGAIVDISFAIEPDGNFELYDSDRSFHAFKNNGFGLSSNVGDNKSIFDDYRGVKKSGTTHEYLIGDGSPTRFQDNSGVGATGLTWNVVDPGDEVGIVQGPIQNITFGTSPSNPFIIPQALVKFRARFKIINGVEGSTSVKAFVTNVLKGYFSDGDTSLAGVDFFPPEIAVELTPGQDRSPTVSIDQFMNSSNGYGFIPDTDKRARTVVSCFSKDEYNTPLGVTDFENAFSAVGYFAVNKADVTFSLRYSEDVNNAVSGDAEYDVGPIFSLHIDEVSNVETVTMIPRITRSGSRGWIYFTKFYLSGGGSPGAPLAPGANDANIRKICLLDSPQQPDPDISIEDNDYNIFFLSRHFCPITDNTTNAAQTLSDAGVGGNFLRSLTVRPLDFLNAGALEVIPVDPSTGFEIGDTRLGRSNQAFEGFQGTSKNFIGGGSVVLSVSGSTELDNDFRVESGKSTYPGAQTYLSQKLRHIGYLELNPEPDSVNGEIIRIADPVAPSGIIYSIIDGEVNIRQNYQAGRLSPSYWYGVYYDTEYGGRNNNQFALSEGSNSSSPEGLHHGKFSYKTFAGQEATNILDELIPEIEPGRASFSLTSTSISSGATGRSFKRNCSHSFALLYYDERGRPGEPVPLGSHFVAQVANPGLASIRLDIDPDTTLPDWAHTYKVLYGGNNSISDFVQYTAGGAFTPPISDDKNGVIYVSLNYLQHNNEVSYSKSFGAVKSDGDKDLYTYSEGDILRIISYYNDDSEVVYPRIANPHEFQVIDTVTLNDDPVQNPLAVEGEEVHPAKTGQFVIIKDNKNASGFSFQDVSNSGSDGQTSDEIYNPNNYWNRRCVFEIFTPQKKKEVESRVYYEIGKSYNVVRGNENSDAIHQTTSILIDQGDVYFRKMAVNMPDFDFETQSFAGLIGDGTDTIDEKTSPNFRSYHLESKAFTDIFPNADVLPYGKPRVALQKVQPTTPTIATPNIQSGSSSNQYTRKSSLKFSDRSNANSNIVRYTSFNDSKLPFKDLQANDGEIFYLVNYADSIFCIQRLKCSSIPVSRNILSDALGNETVINTAKVLGTEKYYAGNYGTDVPESVTEADSAVYFVSVRNKEVYRFNPNSGIEVISEKGMGSFFDSVLSDAETKGSYKVTGGFDADQQEFILSVTAPLTTLENPDRPAPFNTVPAQQTSIQDFLEEPAEVGPVVTVNETEISQNEQIADLQQEVFELQDENNDLIEINEELSAQDFVGVTQAQVDDQIDFVVSTIIGAVGDGGLTPNQYANPGPLTPEQLQDIENVITAALEAARDDGADSVDFNVPDTLNDDQQAQLTSIIDNAAADFDLTDTDGFTLEQQNQFDQIQTEAVQAFGNTPFEELTPDQQDIYTGIEESNDAQIEADAILQADGDYTAGLEAGQDSVDLTDFDSLTAVQQGQYNQIFNTGFTDGQISVDLGQPGVSAGNLNAAQLESLTAYVSAAAGNLDISDFNNLNEAQQEQYNAIIALGVENLLTRFDQADPNNLEATLTPQESTLYLEIRSSNDQEIINFANQQAFQSFYNQFSLQAVADAAQNNDTTNFSQEVLNEYNDLVAGEPVDFDDVRALFESGGVSGPEAADLLDALLTANPSAGFDLDGDGSLGVSDLLGFLGGFGLPVDPIQAPESIGSVFTDADADAAADSGGTPPDQNT